MAEANLILLMLFQASLIFGDEFDIYKNCPKNGAHLPPKPMPTIHRNLILLKEDCGQVCDTSDRYVKKAGKYFDMIEKRFECQYLFDHHLDPPLLEEQLVLKNNNKKKAVLSPPDVYDVPPAILEMFLYERRVPIHYFFMNDNDWSSDKQDKYKQQWTQRVLEVLQDQIRNGTLDGSYGRQESLNIQHAIKDHMLDQVKDGHVLVIGSQTPWIEAILLYFGAAKITTLEYSKIVPEHPKLNVLTPKDLRNQVLSGNPPAFDAMVTFSSLEHSGLGRYGDALNPWGDLITMAQTWCLMKPGGRALVGVPSGADHLYFNTNRLYGKLMSSHLFANWNQIHSTYRDFGPEGLKQKASNFCENDDSNLEYCFQPITILEKPKDAKNSEF